MAAYLFLIAQPRDPRYNAAGRRARFAATGRQVLQTRRGRTRASTTHAVRRVTMAGAVSTVAGNGEEGFADGAGAAARFNTPNDLVVDGEGVIVVADT